MGAAGKDTIRRNGYALSWASLIIKVENDEFFGFTGIDVEEKIERAIARGTDRGGPPRAITRGQYSVEGSTIKGHVDSMAALLEKLAAKSPNGLSYGYASFFASLQYIENGISITEMYHDCYINGRKFSGSPSPDALIWEVPVQITKVTMNTPNKKGLTLFDSSTGRV